MRKVTVLFILLLLSACGKQSGLTFHENALNENFPIDQAVSFSQLKTDILTPHCVRCHSNASTENGLGPWVVAGNPDASPLFLRTEDGSMPKDESPLSTRDLAEIRAYIANLNTGTNPPSPAPAPAPAPAPGTTVTFAQIKSQVLSPYRCTSCHSMSTESGAARFINTSNPDSSSLYTTVKNGSMPQGGSRVPANLQALLLQYVRDYAASH
jgi:cytochrome c553